jgi:hypothetical protein
LLKINLKLHIQYMHVIHEKKAIVGCETLCKGLSV